MIVKVLTKRQSINFIAKLRFFFNIIVYSN